MIATPGESTSLNHRPLTSDMPSSRPKPGEIELTGARAFRAPRRRDALALLDHQHH